MISESKGMACLTDGECTTGSFNGPACMQTVKKLTAGQAADDPAKR